MLSKLWVKDDPSFTQSFPSCVLVEAGIVIIAVLDAFIGVKWNSAVDLLNLGEQTSWLLLCHEFQRQKPRLWNFSSNSLSYYSECRENKKWVINNNSLC